MTTTLANGPFTRAAMTSRLRACLVHLTLSAVVAVLCALLVFGLWYPTPFKEISGGRDLFVLVVTVDVVLGPVITFCIFDRRKPRSELRRDVAVVAALQLAGLAYGLHSVHLARPIVLALEGDRLRVVRAIDLDGTDLNSAPAELRRLPWAGIVPVATRPPTAGEEQDVIDQGLAGRDIGMRPEFWLPPSAAGAALAKAALPVSRLVARDPQGSSEWEARLQDIRIPRERLGYLPLLGRTTNWSALIDLNGGSIVGYVPVDGF
jgi:hypothetical protein